MYADEEKTTGNTHDIKFTFFVYKMEKIFWGNNFHSEQHMTLTIS